MAPDTSTDWRHLLEAPGDRGAAIARRLRRSLWPGAPSTKLLFLSAALIGAVPFFATYVLGWGWWRWSETRCHDHDLGCGLSIHVVGTALVGTLLFGLVFLRKETRAAGRRRKRAKREPERLFRWLSTSGLTGLAMEGRPFVESILGRDPLVEELATDLDESDGSDPQVIVGNTASGKTMVLIKLADHLARRGQVPVVLSLRDVREVDFERLARAAYLDQSGDDEAEAARQWHWMRSRRLITVIVDELEKAHSSVKPDTLVRALDDARDKELRLVAAARPYALPPRHRRGRVDLAPLDPAEVRDDLLRRMTASDGGLEEAEAERVVRRVVDGAEITKTPYYLALARVLADTGDLPAVAEARNVQFALLSGYRDVLRGGRVPLAAAVTAERRHRVLDGLEAIAFVRLLGARTEQEVADLLGELDDGQTDVAETVAYAERLGVLQARHDRRLRFAHPTTLAYFAGCFVAEHRDDDAVLDRVFAPPPMDAAMILAIYMANAAAGSPELAAVLCERLLDRPELAAGGRPPGAGLDVVRVALLETAAAIARATPVGDALTGRIVLSIQNELRDPCYSAGEHLRLVTALIGLPTSAPARALCDYAAAGPEYYVRRQAAKALAAGDADVIEVVLARIEDAMTAVGGDGPEALPEHGDPEGWIDAVAWMLPSLRSLATGAELRERLGDHQRVLVAATRGPAPRHRLEAAIAQGLKLDALRDPALAVDPLALEMLGPGPTRARFWFSRVMLLQAVAVRAVGDASGAAEACVQRAREDEHPFVRQTAELCRRALRAGSSRRYVWEDMTEVATRAPHELSPVTSRLVADIVLSLNLNEYGGHASREEFGRAHALPACLSESPDRGEVLGLSPPQTTCPFARFQDEGCLCPYTYDPPPGAIRRELSRAFCRHQRLHAGRLSWHREISSKRARRFWAEMEQRARF